MKRTFEAGMAFGVVTMIATVAQSNRALTAELLNGVVGAGASTADELHEAAKWCEQMARELNDESNVQVFSAIRALL